MPAWLSSGSWIPLWASCPRLLLPGWHLGRQPQPCSSLPAPGHGLHHLAEEQPHGQCEEVPLWLHGHWVPGSLPYRHMHQPFAVSGPWHCQFSLPKTFKQFQTFLGLLNFYRWCSPHCAAINSGPLWQPERGPASGMLFGDVCCLRVSQTGLSSTTVLAHMAEEAEISLVTDASANHVGAVIQQCSHNSGFFLGSARQSPGELQCLWQGAVRYDGLSRYLCFMPEGKSFFVFTDHKPLVGALNRSSDPWLARQQHHLFFNVEFAPTIQHVTAVSNIVADTLSRPAGDFSLPPALMQLKDGCVTACDSAVSPGGAAAVLVSCRDYQRASSSTSLWVLKVAMQGSPILVGPLLVRSCLAPLLPKFAEIGSIYPCLWL